MEIFRTIVPVPFSNVKINYNTNIMLMGSCFSEYIGGRLQNSKFKTENNPFGIVYNPLSIKLGLERLLNGQAYSQEDIFLHENTWCSFDHHSRFSSPDKQTCLENINRRLREAKLFLQSANVLCLTFGTAYVYYLSSTRQIVSNCHKVPSREFTRKKATVQEIVTTYDHLLQKLFTINPNIHVIFTVSPIRHWKDGAHENQLSKAVLLLAIEEICNLHKQTSYFPSYEIVMDDLRDYRFYAEDMLHPNPQAISYIWNRFKECLMEQDTILLMKEIDKIVQATKHKPFNPHTEAFHLFAKQFYDKILFIKEKYQIEMEEEKAYFKSYLS